MGKDGDYAPSRKLGASRTMPAIAGIAVLRHSPRLNISNADAWSRVVLKPHTPQKCFLSHSFLGTSFPVRGLHHAGGSRSSSKRTWPFGLNLKSPTSHELVSRLRAV